MRSLHLLHLEDDPLDAELVLAHLEEAGFACNVRRVETRQQLVEALDSDTFDLVIADYSLPMFDGMSALRILQERDLHIPFILLSGALGEDLAIESLKSGATDYVLKQRLGRLAPSVRRALREAEDRAQRRQAEAEAQARAGEVADLNARLQRAMAESHHRIKNHLQILAALVEMQILNSGETVPVRELSRLSQHIRTLASLHDLLTEELKTDAESLDAVSLRAALERLIPMLRTASGGRTIAWEAEDIRVSLKQASAFTLLVNELVSNAIKHGAGNVAVTLTLFSCDSQCEEKEEEPCGTCVRLEVCDDGPGFPPGFDPEKAANTGLDLVQSMGEWDLRGKIRYENRPDGGARVVVTFPHALTGTLPITEVA